MATSFQQKAQKDWERAEPLRKKWKEREGEYTKVNPDTGKATWKPGAREQFEKEHEEKYGRGTSTPLNTKQKRTYENGERARESYAARSKAIVKPGQGGGTFTRLSNAAKSATTKTTNTTKKETTSSGDRIRAAMQQAASKGKAERVRAESSTYVKNLKKQAANKAREAAMSKRGG